MGDCIKSTGKIEREGRSISSFRAIEIDDRINLYITQSNVLSLEVEAGKNLQDLISTEVKNGVLKIQNDNRCNWVRSFKKDINVYLSTPTLEEFTYYGSGEVRFQNIFTTPIFRLNMWEASGNMFLQLNCPDIEIKSHTGPADLYCNGTGKKLVAYINGIGRMNLGDLVAKEVLAVNTNSGSLTVSSDSLLEANISGDGDIQYIGSPEIRLNDRGKGELRKLN